MTTSLYHVCRAYAVPALPIIGAGGRVKDVRARVGARLREWRHRRRLTQETLAERAGLSYKFIGEVERGAANPTIETLERLAGALDIDAADLLGAAGARASDADVYGLTPRDVQLVREALESLENVVRRIQPSAPYLGRRRRRK